MPARAQKNARRQRLVEAAHGRVSAALDPMQVQLDVLRLRCHVATEAGPRTAKMTEAAALCDEARRQLDSLRGLLVRAGALAGIR